MIQKNKLLEICESEYKSAKKELKYYSDLFNKQDGLYSVFFAIFVAVIGLFCVIDQEKITLFNPQQMVWPSVVFLAIAYMYFFVIVMGNSYYLIFYSEKVVILEKLMNQCLDTKVYIWETEFMSVIQSKENHITKGYVNVNMIKIGFVIAQYAIIELALGLLWHSMFGFDWRFWLYASLAIAISIFLIWNWFIMWWRLPKHYRKELEHLYETSLREVLEQK